MWGCSLLHRFERDQSKCPLYGIAGCPLLRGLNILLKSMEIQPRHLKVSVILQVSAIAIEGCLLSWVPL